MIPAKITKGKHPRRSVKISLALILALAIAAPITSPQAQSAPSDQITTLHVETNLIEIPVLVLTAHRERIPSPIAADKFRISLGGSPWVHPKYVRREGEDPIDLAIVIDPRAPQARLLKQMTQALAELSPSSLSARDHVSIFFMGCSSIESIRDLPSDPKRLTSAMDSVLSAWTKEKEADKKSPCLGNTQLWDVLAFVTRVMSTKPGRRTILVITNGDDNKSVNTPQELIPFTQATGVTIFGLNPITHSSRNPLLRSAGENLLSFVTESSGGITIMLEGQSLDKALKSFIQMLRDRYIIQFPRPSDAKAGKTEFAVTVIGPDLFVRTAGKSVPLPDPVEPLDGANSRPDELQ